MTSFSCINTFDNKVYSFKHISDKILKVSKYDTELTPFKELSTALTAVQMSGMYLNIITSSCCGVVPTHWIMGHWRCSECDKVVNYDANKLEEQLELFGAPAITFDGCNHEYVLYTGLKEQFNHCKKCGVKQ